MDSEGNNRLQLTITSGRRLIDSALSPQRRGPPTTTPSSARRLEWYRSNQLHMFYVIPTGPKSIAGMEPYKRFLEAIRQGLLEEDPSALVTVATPDA